MCNFTILSSFLYKWIHFDAYIGTKDQRYHFNFIPCTVYDILSVAILSKRRLENNWNKKEISKSYIHIVRLNFALIVHDVMNFI
jgi:hypothetical protein